ncbi:MAG: exodeoxyribonuclease VII large subunit [Solirubrobacteraceae bacterium MAG38_C4-C5]|nr:exodeoxyribonuclease VII large subunit [Candidatus Siliceabacter maunaloa]
MWNLRETRVRVYFELRDAQGALPCAMWGDDLVALGLSPGVLTDGAQVVVGGGLDYYPGAATSSPAFSFHVTDLRVAGEGDCSPSSTACASAWTARACSRPREGAAPPGRATHDRRGHGRGRQGTRRRAGRPGPPRRAQAREQVLRDAERLAVHAGRAVVDRGRTLARLSRAPGAHLERERGRLHQSLREMRAAARRGTQRERERTARHALILDRKVKAAGLDGRRRQRLDALAAALGAHDPQRMVERGYALVEDADGGVVTSAATARERGALRLRFGDGAVDATVDR